MKKVIISIILILGITTFLQSQPCTPPPPIPTISFSPTAPCGGVDVQLTASPIDPSMVYSWTFDNGLTDELFGGIVIYQFPEVGTDSIYNIELTITDIDGCTSTTIAPITISATPDFEVTGIFSACLPSFSNVTTFATSFEIVGGEAGASYDWFFGDGETLFNSTDLIIPHTYLDYGTYNLVVQSSNGTCLGSFEQTVTFYKRPTANMSIVGDPDICEGDTIFVQNNTDPAEVNFYVWDWGNGVLDTVYDNSPAFFVYEFGDDAICNSPPPAGAEFEVTLIAHNDCLSHSNSSPIFVSLLPRAIIEQPDTLCASDPTLTFGNLSCPSANSGYFDQNMYEWDFGDGTTSTETNPTHTFPGPGNYTVTMEATNSCGFNLDTVEITVIEDPIADGDVMVAVSDSLCIPFEAYFTNMSTGDSLDIEWIITPSTGWTYINGTDSVSQNPAIEITEIGGYNVQLTASNFCGTSTWDTTILAITIPDIELDSIGFFCDEVTITPTYTFDTGGSPNTTYTWEFPGGIPSSANTMIPPSVFYADPNTYDIIVTIENECSSATDTVTFLIDPTPPADAGPDLDFCIDDSPYQLNGIPAGGTFSGTGITSNGLFTPQFAGVGNHQVFYENLNLDCPTYDTVDIVVNPLPIVDAGGLQSTCVNDGLLTLTGATPIGGTWSGTGIVDPVNGVFDPTVTGVGSFNVTYTYTDANMCVNTDFKTIDVIGLPVINAGGLITFCNIDDDLQITGFSPSGGIWSGIGITDANQGLFNPNTAGGVGNYPVTYTFTDINGCTNSDVLTVVVENLVAVDAGNDLDVCINDPIFDLTGFSPSGGLWSGVGITDVNVGTFYPQAAGVGSHEIIYTIGVGACAVSDTIDILIFGLPTIDAGSNETWCENATDYLLSGYTPIGGVWSGSGIVDGNTGEFSPSTAGVGTHSISYTYVDPITNCESVDTKQIIITALPTVEAGPDVIYCNIPDDIVLTNYTPLGGTWSGDGIVDPSGLFNPNGAGGVGNYEAVYTFTDANSCTNTDTLQIEVIAPIPVEAGPSDTVCIDAAVFVQSGYAPLGGTWAGPGIINSTGGLFSPSQAGTGLHVLTYTYGIGSCIETDTKEIYVAPLPVIDPGTDFSVCESDIVFTLPTFSPTDGVWSGTGITNPTGSFDPQISGVGTFTLTLSYTDPLTMCQNDASIDVTVNTLPIVEAGDPISYCNTNDNINLMDYFPTGGIWSGSGIIDGTNGTFNAAVAGGVGQYDLVYSFTDGNSCTNTDTLIVTIIDADIVDLGPNDTICIDNGILIQSGYMPLGGSWSGSGIINSSGGVFDPTVAGIGLHTLTYSIGSGTCLIEETKTIWVADLPIVNAGNDEQVCVDALAYNLLGYSPASGGVWSGNGVDASGLFDPTLAGVGGHTLTYTYQDPITNCINTDIKVIIVTPLPIVNVGDTVIYCDNPDNIQLMGFSPQGGTWLGTGIVDPVNGVFNSENAGGIGIYEAEYIFTDNNGCTNQDTLIIDVIYGDTVNAGLDTALCIDFGLYNLYGFSPSGGIWSGSGIVNSDGIFDPLAAGVGVHTLTYTYGIGTCEKTDTKDILVGTIPIVNAGPDETGCSANPSYTLMNFSPPDGIWTGAGIINPVGVFDPGTAGAGDHILTYTYTNPLTGCEASNTKIISLQAAPVVEAGSDITICNSSTDVVFNNFSPLGGIWTGTGIIDALNGIFNSTIAGGPGDYTVYYGFTSSNGCYNEDSLTVTVLPPPLIDAGLDTALCIDNGLFILDNFTPIGGIWSGDGIVNTSGAFDPTAAGLGLHILTYTFGEETCEVTDNMTILVGTPPLVNAGDDEVICVSSSLFTLDDFSPQGGYWTGVGIVDSFDFDPTGLGVGTYTIMYNYTNNVSGCEVTDTRDILIEDIPLISVVDTIVYCNTFDDLLIEGYSPQGGTWSGPGIINQNTGVFNTTIAGGEGEYTVYYEYSNNNGCAAIDSITIEVIFGDVVEAGPNIAMCIDEGASTLTGFSPLGGVWIGTGVIDPLGIFDPVVAGEGLHVLTYTFGEGSCEKTDQIEVFVGVEPVVVAGPDEEACLSVAPFQLSGFNPPGGIWIGPGVTDPSGTFNPASAGVGIHSLTYTYINPLSGCEGSAIKDVEVVPIPAVYVGDTLDYCNNSENVFLAASPLGGVWSGPGILDPLNGIFNTGSAGGIGEYELIYTFVQNNGCDGRDTLIVNVIPPPMVEAGLPDTLCINDGLFTLSSFGPLGGEWSGVGIVDPFLGVFNPSAAGSGLHTITYTYGEESCEVTDVKNIFVGELPEIILGNDIIICEGDDPFGMTGFSPQGGLWSGPGITDPILGTFDPTLVSTGVTIISYSYTNIATNCSNQEDLEITVVALPNVSVADTVVYCNSTDDITLEGFNPLGGTWIGAGIINGTNDFNTTLAGGEGQYDVVYTFTDNNGCTNSDTMLIDVIFGDTVDAGPDIAICIDEGIVTFGEFMPQGGIWSGAGIIDPSLGTFDPASVGIGTHTVFYTYGEDSCEKTDTKTIIVGSIPTVNAGADEVYCLDELPFLIDDQSPSGGYWLGMGVDSMGNFIPVTAGVGTHVLTYTFVNPVTGCENSDTKAITITALPVVFVGDTVTYCNSPNTITLEDVVPIGGTWSGPGIIASSGEFNTTQAGGEGLYDLVYTVVDNNGCVGTDTLIVDVIYGDTVQAGPDFALCITNGILVLSDYSPLGGEWSGSGIIDGVTGVFDPALAGNGNHVLTYTYGEGTCEKTDTRTVTVGLVPPVFVGQDEVVCEDTPAFDLTGFSPLGGTWSGNGIVDPLGVFDPLVAGVGVHTLTYQFIQASTGCENSETKVITVEATPIVDAGGTVVYCDNGEDIVLDNYTPAGGVWTGPGIVNGIFGVFNTTQAGGEGQYELVYSYTNPNGCFNTDTLLVDVIYGDTVIAGPTINMCVFDGPINLEGSPLGGTWTGIGIVNPTGTFSPGLAGVGTHVVTYTYGLETCEKTDVRTIVVGGLPTVDAGVDESFCIDETATLLGGFGPSGGEWTGTGVDSSGLFDPSLSGVGIFELTYTFIDSISGCENNDIKFVNVNPLPLVNAGDTTLFCVWDELITLEGYTPLGGTWTGTGIVDPTVGTFSTTAAGGVGTYDLIYAIIDNNGCSNIDTLVVVVEAGETLDSGPDESVCLDNGLFQIATFTPFGGSWTGLGIVDEFNGVFDPSIAGVGIHQLTYTYGVGTCEREAIKNIEVFPLPFVDIGEDATICENEDSYPLNPLPSGGTWTGVGIDSVGNFDPQAAGLGDFELIYTYTNPVTNCTNVDTLNLTVAPLPLANYTHPLEVCEGETVSFVNNSTGANTYLWQFGDATNSSLEIVDHTYTNSGIYDISLIVYSAEGCTDTLTSVISVLAEPNTMFVMDVDDGCAPLEVTFTDGSTGLNLDYYWDFGNGQTSILATPDPITYLQITDVDTFYIVTLTITNQCGSSTMQDTIDVHPIPVIDFGSDISTGCTPLSVNFTNNTTGLADSYYWDFGNGQTSSDSIPPAQVFTAGTTIENYTVTLIASNSCGADTSTTVIEVLPATINSFFNVDVTEGCQPLEVNFTNLSTPGASLTWDFDDGSFSVFQNPTHTFDTSGVFTVTLYATNNCGVDSSTVDITVYPIGEVDFDIVNYSCVEDSVVFTNQSLNILVSEWDFGDGTTSSLSNPTHAYDNPGTYTVTLTGYSASENCPATITKVILIRENPEVDLALDMSDGCSPLTIQFQNTSPIMTYSQWDFGDGSSSVLDNPTHTYTVPGTYAATLTNIDNWGCTSDSSILNIIVYPSPVAAFDTDVEQLCNEVDVVTFINQSTDATSYEWDFDNGITSQFPSPEVTYNDAGMYDVTLTASNPFGCTNEVVQQFEVLGTPIADFSIQDNDGCEDFLVEFYQEAANADYYEWDFGDGSIGEGPTPSHLYTEPGTYDVSLYIAFDNTCFDTIVLPNAVEVYETAVAGFDIIQNGNGWVDFVNTSQNATNYFWDLGDGTTSTDEDITHRYEENGTRVVMLIANNPIGCPDTLIVNFDPEFFYGLQVPNAFSPETGVGPVRQFFPIGFGLKDYHIQVFTPWGELMWEAKGVDDLGRPTEFWDGYHDGVIAPQGAYVWKVIKAEFIDGTEWQGMDYGDGKKRRIGSVTLLR